MGSADVSANGPDVDGAANEAQGSTSSSAFQGRAEAQAGPAGSVVSGSAQRDAHEQADNAVMQADVSYQADVASEGVANAEAGAQVDARDAAIEGAGVQGEVATYNEVQGERAHREGQVNEAQADADRAKAIQADPSGSAKTAARGEADARIQAATPDQVGQAQADANFARGAVADPTGTAQGEAEVKIEGSVGFDPTPKK